MNGVESVFLAAVILLSTDGTYASSISRSKEYKSAGSMGTAGSDEVSLQSKHDVKISQAEPSCEQLKAMWRFSKRQSRAAEITNEIPTYRDPFSYNVWESYYPRTRGGMRVMGGRLGSRPGGIVYGRVVHKTPSFRVQDIAERNRAFEEVSRMFGSMNHVTEPRRRVTAFRLGGGAGLHMNSMAIAPQSGSFQHLKELIRTERARELQEQRMAEEVAARAAALKELSRGVGRDRHRYLQDTSYITHSGDEELVDQHDRDKQEEQLANSRVGQGVVSFPDLLAPASPRFENILYAEPPPDSTDRNRLRFHSPSYQPSSYRDDFDSEFML